MTFDFYIPDQNWLVGENVVFPEKQGDILISKVEQNHDWQLWFKAIDNTYIECIETKK